MAACPVCGGEFDKREGYVADIRLIETGAGFVAENVMVCSGRDGCQTRVPYGTRHGQGRAVARGKAAHAGRAITCDGIAGVCY